MSEAIGLQTPLARSHDGKVIAVVGGAHLVSHYYILLLPPLFAFVRADFAVSWTEIGLALAAFNVTSAVLQTPAGFLVDRVGARAVLAAGLALGGVAVAVAGLASVFWLFVLAFAFAGVANTVYHPADYAMLSQSVSPERMAPAFSIHTFLGLVGGTIAPGSLLFMQGSIGWRGAFLVAGLVALAYAALVALVRMPVPLAAPPAAVTGRAAAAGAGVAADWRLLLAAPILLNLVFFATASVANAGLQNYSVVALGALFATAPGVANAALTAYLAMSALGVLAGGVIAARTRRHDRVAFLGFAVMTVCTLVIGATALSTLPLIAVMGLVGIAYGITMPSRDMIVRAVTPAGAFGRVFGFVTTGFNIGGIVAPLLFGWLMDSGRPFAVFAVAAGCCVLTLAAIAIGNYFVARAGHARANG
ncbi:MAG: MFS transporter [Proteobacteria bacterium]|nr:MFS transporter [Pseudomonadota bacterium]